MITIGGFVTFSSIDYPGYLAAVVFCQGCPYRCPYCQNPALIPMTPQTDQYKWNDIVTFLKTRQGLLDAVVFSGGEPLSQPQLPQAIQEIKTLGFKIGLHTAGPNPDLLTKIIKYVDWIGMDIKAPFADYASITGVKNSGAKALESAKIILKNKTPCDFRTTIHPLLLTERQILQIAQELKDLGADNYHLQKFQPKGCQNKELITTSLDNYPSEKLQESLKKLFKKFTVT